MAGEVVMAGIQVTRSSNSFSARGESLWTALLTEQGPVAIRQAGSAKGTP